MSDVTITWEREPFPHAVTDGLWDPAMLEAAAAEFPPGDDPRWISFGGEEERGKMGSRPEMWGEATRAMLDTMIASAPLLERLTGIPDLTGDLWGGGMHMTGDGGRLAMHADFNWHPDLKMVRRLNLLVFLNHEWEREWGGVLYLGANRETEILPLFNRTAIFQCGEESWHGHPEPVTGGHWRKSLACYFYSPAGVVPEQHSTIWLGRAS